MEAIPINLERGRCRNSVYIVKLNKNIEHEIAQNTAKLLFVEKRQIICSGFLPVTADGTLFPFSSAEVLADIAVARVLFVLKRYESDVRISLIPRNLNFWRGEFENNVDEIQTAPRFGRYDFINLVVKRLTQNDYLALDAFGNRLSLEEQMAEKSSGKTTKLITSLLKRNISSFNEVLDENPVLAFHNEKKLRNLQGLRRY